MAAFTPVLVNGAPRPDPPAPKWPRAIAWIGFAFAALTALYGFGGLVGPYQQGVAGWVRPMNSTPLVLSIPLIVGLVQLLRHRPAAPRLCTVWSWLFLLWVTSAITVNYWHARSFGWTPSAQPGGVAGYALTLLVGIILTCTLPVFMLLWFSRDSVKRQVGTWPSAR